jgi:hypothetical protein
VVFEHQNVQGIDGDDLGALYTRAGSKGQIAWTSTTNATFADGGSAPQIAALNQLNGLNANGQSYLPTLATPVPITCTADGNQVDGENFPSGKSYLTAAQANPQHDDDAEMNYEPTVNPVASGGYAWVVFTSRRMYGNEATIPPYCSDPRGVDLVHNITTKKLWVAAVDINGKVSTDPSHPAFYLPGQELLAGNARGFWVLEPCRQDGSACSTGDQCCNGFCEANGDAGALVCSQTTITGNCSQTLDKCTTTADCCDQINNSCIGGFCTQNTITVVPVSVK